MFTIEPDGDRFDVYEHGVYERWSVLAGHDRRTFRGSFETVEAAQAAFPSAEVLDHSTKVRGNPMPTEPPDWFDPADAGEAWGEDDY